MSAATRVGFTGDEVDEGSIKALDGQSIHKISSGQVVVDLQTAVKELVENSVDAGASSIEVRFKEYGLEAIEVVDNGSGIAPADYDAIALKHHTSKLDTFEDLSTVSTFGFRGEALSSLCALSEGVTVVTATSSEAPMGTVLEMDKVGRIKSKNGRIARQRGTTVSIIGLFRPLPVRRKELERNMKREFGKALSLLNAYALIPCTKENQGIRLTCTNQTTNGRKTVQLRTDGSPSLKSAVTSIWGPKSLDNVVELDLSFEVETEKAVLRRLGSSDMPRTRVGVQGLISKFVVGGGRNGTDRQYFFVNGRPCNPSKVQKAFNEVYRTFNANQSPFIVADFILPGDSLDINISPDKRTIFIHSENNLVQALKVALEEKFTRSRATYDVTSTQPKAPLHGEKQAVAKETTLFLKDSDDEGRFPQDGESLHVTVNVNPPDAAGPRMPDPQQPVNSKDVEGRSNDSIIEHVEAIAPDRATCPPMAPTAGPPLPTGEPSSPSIARVVVEDSCAPQSLQNEATGDQRSILKPSSRREGTTRKPSVSSSNRSPSVSKKPSSSAKVQMTLSTSNASWNLSRSTRGNASTSDIPRPTKKLRLEDPGTRQSVSAQEGLKLKRKLTDFALPGSQLPAREVVETSDSGAEEDFAVQMNHLDVADAGVSSSPGHLPQDTPTDHQIVDSVTNHGASGEDVEMEETSVGHQDVAAGGLTYKMDLDTPGSQLTGASNVTQPIAASSALPTEVIRTSDGGDIVMRFDAKAVADSWRQMRSLLATTYGIPPGQVGGAETTELTKTIGLANAEDDDKASETLSRVLDKGDFGEMEVIGQFNRGFIISRRRKAGSSGDPNDLMDDLFIVDQHAADEKYNFEKLQETTKLDSQKLISPLLLELPASDALLAIENAEVLHQNGFEIEVNGGDVDGNRRLKLVAQPVSKTTVFDLKDLEELLHLMHDQPAGQMVRCSKTRAMFASRACRKSFMIGMPLTAQQMTSVVRHMGAMDQPWHCPHGRPTMRHLSDIVGMGWSQEISWRKLQRPVSWDTLG